MVLRLLQPNLWQATQLLQGESGLGIGEVQDGVQNEPVYIATWMLILDRVLSILLWKVVIEKWEAVEDTLWLL